jgi:hypothetical protein
VQCKSIAKERENDNNVGQSSELPFKITGGFCREVHINNEGHDSLQRFLLPMLDLLIRSNIIN